jgi:hypothetical protein
VSVSIVVEGQFYRSLPLHTERGSVGGGELGRIWIPHHGGFPRRISTEN